MADLGNLELLDTGKVKEKAEGVSEEDIGRVLENLKKARQVRQQIQAVKKEEWKLAKVLEFIIKHIDSDTILKIVINFYQQNPKNVYYLFSLMFPFLKEDIKGEVLEEIVEKLSLKKVNVSKVSRSLEDYVDFTKEMYKNLSISDLDKNLLSDFVVSILVKYRVGVLKNISFSSQKEKEEFLIQLYDGVFNELKDL